MSADRLRAGLVVAIVAIATLGEGGASAASLLAAHIAVGAGVLAFASLPPADRVVERGPVRAWLAFAILAALSAFAAPYAFAAWLVIVDVLAFGALVWLSAGAASSLARLLPPGVALVATAHAAVAVAARLAGAPRPASSFLNPNHLGAWLAAAALVLAGVLLRRGQSPAARAGGAAAGAAALAGVFVTGSRGAALGFAAGVAVLLGLGWRDLAPRARRAVAAAAAIAVVVVGSGIAVRFLHDADPYRYTRLRIWRASLGAAAASPLTGAGPGQFAAAAANLDFPQESAPLRYERSFRTPHSDLIRAVSEFGIPAGLAALLAAALFAAAFLRRFRAAAPVERGAFAALTALAVQGAFDDLSSRPAVVALAAALCGLLAARPRPAEARPPSRAVAVAAAALLAMALGPGEIAGYLAWRDAAAGRFREAIAWNRYQPDYFRSLAVEAVGDGRAWDAAGYAAAREDAERARRLQPKDAVYALADARVEAAACLSLFPFEATRGRAARLYAAAAALARTDAGIPLEEAMFLLRAGDPAGARRAAEAALRIEPRAAAPRLVLAKALLLAEGSGGDARARALLDEAVGLALPPGALPSSPYDAAMRALDPDLLAAVRADLAAPGR